MLLSLRDVLLDAVVDAFDQLVANVLHHVVIWELVHDLSQLTGLGLSLLGDQVFLLITELLFDLLTDLLLTLLFVSLHLLIRDLQLEVPLCRMHLEPISELSLWETSIDSIFLVTFKFHLDLASTDHVLHRKLALHASKVLGQVAELLRHEDPQLTVQ